MRAPVTRPTITSNRHPISRIKYYLCSPFERWFVENGVEWLTQSVNKGTTVWRHFVVEWGIDAWSSDGEEAEAVDVEWEEQAE